MLKLLLLSSIFVLQGTLFYRTSNNAFPVVVVEAFTPLFKRNLRTKLHDNNNYINLELNRNGNKGHVWLLFAEEQQRISSSGSKSVGPRGERRTRSGSSGERRRRSGSSSGSGPRQPRQSRERRVPTTTATKRAPHQFDHKKADARPFVSSATEVKFQVPNENAIPYDLIKNDNGLRCMLSPSAVVITDDKQEIEVATRKTVEDDSTSSSSSWSSSSSDANIITHPHFRFLSLDEVFPNLGFSQLFHESREFRDALRNSMRVDIFDSTPLYAGVSEKARKMLLLPDSSLEGSWKCYPTESSDNKNQKTNDNDNDNDGENDSDSASSLVLRMKNLTLVLKKYLGPDAPTGDEFMETIGSLCGTNPTMNWLDNMGITDRKISHSWHQDNTGRSGGVDGSVTQTVELGFPSEDSYCGTGVFTHLVPLQHEQIAPQNHPTNEPIAYAGTVPEEYVVRPQFTYRKELLIYRGIDVLHSEPDVAYRNSVMRFM